MRVALDRDMFSLPEEKSMVVDLELVVTDASCTLANRSWGAVGIGMRSGSDFRAEF